MDSPGAWTYRVALNVLRRRARRAGIEDVLLRRRWIDDAEMSPLLDPELWAAVRALPLRQRTAVALRYVDDLSYSEIASRMGIAVGTVAPTLAKAHQRLARSLGEEPVTVSGGTQ